VPRTIRLVLFLVSMGGIAAALPFVVAAMPGFGTHPLPYGELINHVAPVQRHVTNMVTAVNFDYRGFDTLGEEIMLLAAVTGTAVLLRSRREDSPADRPATAPGRPIPPRSEGLALAGRLFGPLTMVFGLYVVLHGSVAVTTTKGRQSIELARLREGEIFGEMSLITRQPATATVTSGGNSILLRLPRESFQELAVTHPQILALVSELTEPIPVMTICEIIGITDLERQLACPGAAEQGAYRGGVFRRGALAGRQDRDRRSERTTPQEETAEDHHQCPGQGDSPWCRHPVVDGGRRPPGAVMELVEAHGGTVVAESPGKGQGSSFTVRLPRHAAVDGQRTTPSSSIGRP